MDSRIVTFVGPAEVIREIAAIDKIANSKIGVVRPFSSSADPANAPIGPAELSTILDCVAAAFLTAEALARFIDAARDIIRGSSIPPDTKVVVLDSESGEELFTIRANREKNGK